MLVPLNIFSQTLLGEYGTVLVLSCFDFDPINGLLAPAQSFEVNFYTEGGLRWFPYNCNGSCTSRGPVYDSANRGAPLLRQRDVSAIVTSLPRRGCV